MCTAVCLSRKSPRRLPASSPLAGPHTATHAAAACLQHTCLGKTINTVCFVSLFSMFLPRGSKGLNSWFYWACCFSACAHARMCVHGGGLVGVWFPSWHSEIPGAEGSGAALSCSRWLVSKDCCSPCAHQPPAASQLHPHHDQISWPPLGFCFRILLLTFAHIF